MESDAVLLILSLVRDNKLQLWSSRVHHVELAANPDATQRQHISILLKEYSKEILVNPLSLRQRAEELTELGMGVADAAHVAFAEAAGCDFVSVDDRLIRQCARIPIAVWSGSPMAYCDKENLK